MRRILFFIFILQLPIVGGCETLYTGKGYTIHDDKEAMDFAWVWFNKKDNIAAQHSAELALKINPQNSDAYNLLGLIALRNNDPLKSVDYLKQSYEILKKRNAPYQEYLLNNLGFAYYDGGEYLKAIESFKNAADIRRNYISDFGLGITYLALGKTQDGLEKIEDCKKDSDFSKNGRGLLEYFNVPNKENLIELLKL